MWITTAGVQNWSKLPHTHRTSCRRPRGLGEVNPNPQWIPVFAPVYSLPQRSEIPFTQHQSVAQNTPLSLARRSFPPLHKSRLKTPFLSVNRIKPYPVWFSCRRKNYTLYCKHRFSFQQRIGNFSRLPNTTFQSQFFSYAYSTAQ